MSMSAALPKRRHMGRRAFLMGMVATTALVVLERQALAYDVWLTPTDPQLGDTISVMVQATSGGNTPAVTVNDRSQYPVFPMGQNLYRALIPTSPLDPPGRMVIRVSGGPSARNLAVGLRNRSFPTQRITLPPGSSNLGTQHEFDRVAAFKTIVTPQKFWDGPMVRPSQGRVSTEYGIRRYYNGVFAEDYYHRGVDYAAGTGSPVVAPAAGYVALVGRVSDGFELHGNTIGIDHGQGVLSIMIHLSRIDVNEGDFVRPGQVIGGVGSTGASTGPHLHWGLYVHGIAVDPVPWRYTGFQ
jgi:murein DD-endopeptidase MepM/ murein hydrolase activator NlpD